MTTTWPDTLLASRAYHHPIESPRIIETHISWVVLTGRFAYKFKKPVDLGFLDFTTLERRRYFCERELTLNGRFSAGLYLDVVPVTGSREAPCVDGAGEAFDYAVSMRQFDTGQLADNLARTGRLTGPLVTAIAKTLAAIHCRLPALDIDSSLGQPEAFHAAAMENFAEISTYPLPDDIRRHLQAQQQWMLATYRAHRRQMAARRREGRVKDCHGDCHLGNIVVLDGEVTLFDCIEFNDSFRICDTIAEAAFLNMDMCARELPEAAQHFLNAYLAYSGDYAGLAQLDMYRCHYALVRAKVNLLRHPAGQDAQVTQQTQAECFRYLALADRFSSGRTPALVLMHGLSGSGKSYLAERLAGRMNAIHIRSDVERKRMFGLEPEESGTAVTGMYTAATSRRVFGRLLDLAHAVIAAGFCCIVDATFLSRASRKPFVDWAYDNGISLSILHCSASDDTSIRRIQARALAGGDPSDADSEVYRSQKRKLEPLSPREASAEIRVDTERADCIELAAERLAAGHPGRAELVLTRDDGRQ